MIQAGPSRLKVDLWCSYVTVDIRVMNNLQVKSLGRVDVRMGYEYVIFVD